MKKLFGILLTLLLLVSSLPQMAFAAQSADFDQEFTQYLAELSTERGREVTKDQVEASLAIYDLSLEDFDTIQEVKDFLGNAIKADYSNLSYIYETYGLNLDTLKQLLEDNGDDISDYIYLSDLETAVYFYQNGGSDETDNTESDLDKVMNELLPVILEKIDLTDAEIEQLTNHFNSISEELSGTEFQEKYKELNNRMLDLMEAAISGEKSREEISAEMTSIYEEFLPMLHLKTVITLKQDGQEKEISLKELFDLQELDQDASLKVALYNTDSQFLADLVISGDMFESGQEAEEQLQNVTEEVIKTVDKVSSEHAAAKTAKGAKLPKTASDHAAYASFGLITAFAGLIMFRKVRKKDKIEIIQK